MTDEERSESDHPESTSEIPTDMTKAYPICGAKKSQGGDECTLKAGWTTDHVGEEKYKLTVASLPISSTVTGCTPENTVRGCRGVAVSWMLLPPKGSSSVMGYASRENCHGTWGHESWRGSWSGGPSVDVRDGNVTPSMSSSSYLGVPVTLSGLLLRGLKMMYEVKVMRSLILAALLVAGSTNALLGQDRAARLREVYSAEAAAQIEAVVEAARRNGVPEAPLYNKALEGAAKRVSAARLMPVLRDYSGLLQRAQGLLGGTSEVAWLVAGADALRRGVEGDALTSIGQDAGARTPMALVVMGDLVEAGVPAGRAMEVMREALVRTTGDEGLLDVPTALRRLVRDGALAPDAAGEMLRAMRDGVPLRRMRDSAPRRSDARPPARPGPQGSDPTRVRPPV